MVFIAWCKEGSSRYYLCSYRLHVRVTCLEDCHCQLLLVVAPLGFQARGRRIGGIGVLFGVFHFYLQLSHWGYWTSLEEDIVYHEPNQKELNFGAFFGGKMLFDQRKEREKGKKKFALCSYCSLNGCQIIGFSLSLSHFSCFFVSDRAQPTNQAKSLVFVANFSLSFSSHTCSPVCLSACHYGLAYRLCRSGIFSSAWPCHHQRPRLEWR